MVVGCGRACGKIKEGDELLRVNGETPSDLNHATNVIRDALGKPAGTELELVWRRPNGMFRQASAGLALLLEEMPRHWAASARRRAALLNSTCPLRHIHDDPAQAAMRGARGTPFPWL